MEVASEVEFITSFATNKKAQEKPYTMSMMTHYPKVSFCEIKNPKLVHMWNVYLKLVLV